MDRDIKANIVFLYYQDLQAAITFYSDILGLQEVFDNDYEKIYQTSPTSFVGLVDEAVGRHKASEPKTITLSFITDQIDEWYDHLIENGVKMFSQLKTGTNIPIRGFVAYDPEGYFLEFEMFRNDPQNEKLLDILSNSEPLYTKIQAGSSEENKLGFSGNIFWLYYKNYEKAQQYYEEVYKLELLVNQPFSKIYFSSPTSFVGLVDETKGLHKASDNKAVTLSFITNNPKSWQKYLSEQGQSIIIPLETIEDLNITRFVTLDIEGYNLEFVSFGKNEKNTGILNIINQGKN